MTELEPSSHPERLTAWHPMLVALLEMYLPAGWQLIPELLLSRLPQRIDIVILELVGTAPGAAHELLSIFQFLRPHTLIEHKGPTDALAAEDALVLLAYGAQYMRLKKLKDPADLCLMVIANRIPPSFVEQVSRLQGCFERIGAGLWRGTLAGAVLHGVETSEAARTPTERLLYMFSQAFLEDPRGGLPLDEEARKVYALLLNQVEQFRRIRGGMAMKDYELAKMSLDELLQPVVERRLQEMTPEQRVAGLTPEQLAKLLTPEQLTEMVEALPPEVREQIKRRLH